MTAFSPQHKVPFHPKHKRSEKPCCKIGLKLTTKEKHYIAGVAAHRGVSLREFCKQAVMYAIENIEPMKGTP